MKSLFWTLSLLLALTVLLAACQANPGGPAIQVSDVWGRPAPATSSTTAFYMKIHNTGQADRLTGISSPACGSAGLHETVGDPNGVMSMQGMSDGLAIPASGSVELKPGSIHVMCMDKVGVIAAGDKIKLELKFENAGVVTVDAEIRQP